MAVTDKIKAVLSLRGVKQTELARHLGITPQSMRNKFARGSFSAEDLIKIADFLNCSLEFALDEKQSIVLDVNDIRDTGEWNETSRRRGVNPAAGERITRNGVQGQEG